MLREQPVQRCSARRVLEEQQGSPESFPCRQRFRSSSMELLQFHIRNLREQRCNHSQPERHCNRSQPEQDRNRKLVHSSWQERCNRNAMPSSSGASRTVRLRSFHRKRVRRRMVQERVRSNPRRPRIARPSWSAGVPADQRDHHSHRCKRFRHRTELVLVHSNRQQRPSTSSHAGERAIQPVRHNQNRCKLQQRRSPMLHCIHADDRTIARHNRPSPTTSKLPPPWRQRPYWPIAF